MIAGELVAAAVVVACILLAGLLFACVLRVALIVRWPPNTKLPHPSKIGLPMAGPALPKAAHAAIMRKKV